MFALPIAVLPIHNARLVLRPLIVLAVRRAIMLMLVLAPLVFLKPPTVPLVMGRAALVAVVQAVTILTLPTIALPAPPVALPVPTLPLVKLVVVAILSQTRMNAR